MGVSGMTRNDAMCRPILTIHLSEVIYELLGLFVRGEVTTGSMRRLEHHICSDLNPSKNNK